LKQKNDAKAVDHSPFQNNRKVINFQDKEKAVNVKPQLTHK